MNKRLPLAALAALCMLLLAAESASAAVPRSFFGISAVRPTAADYKGMSEKVGAGTVRVEIPWPGVQFEKNADFHWAGVDQRFRRAATFGLRPQPAIFGTPNFYGGKDGLIVPPTKSKKALKGWERFAEAAARRYGPGGTFWKESPTLDPNLAPKNWIVWNEQNARAYWNPKASPSQYAKLLRTTRAAFDRADRGLLITVGGMFGYPENKKSIPAKQFIQQLYRQKGAKQLIDAVSLHPYGSGIKQVKRQVKDARRAMDRSGDRNAKILVGEIGWASGGRKDYFLIKNKRSQKRLLQQSYKFLLQKRNRYGITSAFWFTYRDFGGEEVCVWCPQAGLLNKKGNFKPAGKAYRSLVRKNVR